MSADRAADGAADRAADCPADASADVRVRGGATPEELAAVVAMLRGRESSALAESGYERWRRLRLAVTRARLEPDPE